MNSLERRVKKLEEQTRSTYDTHMIWVDTMDGVNAGPKTPEAALARYKETHIIKPGDKIHYLSFGKPHHIDDEVINSEGVEA